MVFGKKISTGLGALALGMLTMFSQANANDIDQIVFFGDSLSDNGNLYSHDAHILPKSPPYFRGHFSNGPTWAEKLAKHYYNTYYIPMQDYAVGGATAFLHNPFAGFLPVSQGIEIDDYLIRDLFQTKDSTLFFLWIGANDYLPGSQQVDDDVKHVVATIIDNMNTLVNAGAKNIFVLNLPDLALTPLAVQKNRTANLHELTIKHNAQLKIALDNFKKAHPDVNLHEFDSYDLFEKLTSDPNTFNKQNNTHFTDVNTTCWLGGYAMLANQQTQQMIAYELQRENTGKNKLSAKATAQFAQQIMHTPALMESYQTAQSYAAGATPCAHPEQHVFWDHVHPTEAAHSALAQLVEKQVDQYYHFKKLGS